MVPVRREMGSVHGVLLPRGNRFAGVPAEEARRIPGEKASRKPEGSPGRDLFAEAQE